MKRWEDRVSGAFFVVFGLVLLFAIIPNYVDQTQSGNLAPDTMPNALAIILSLSGLALIFKPTNWRTDGSRFWLMAALYAAVIAIAVFAMSYVGFMGAAPVLTLVLMLLIGERRPHWLAIGVVGGPGLIWVVVTQLLDRALP